MTLHSVGRWRNALAMNRGPIQAPGGDLPVADSRCCVTGSAPPQYAHAVEGSQEQRLAALVHLGQLVESLIRELLSSQQIRVHSVTHRVKTIDSATNKVQPQPDRYSDIFSLTIWSGSEL